MVDTLPHPLRPMECHISVQGDEVLKAFPADIGIVVCKSVVHHMIDKQSTPRL